MPLPKTIWSKETEKLTYGIWFRGSKNGIQLLRLDIRWNGYMHFDLVIFGLNFYIGRKDFYGCSYARPVKVLDLFTRWINIDLYLWKMWNGGSFAQLHIDWKDLRIDIVLLGIDLTIRKIEARDYKYIFGK